MPLIIGNVRAKRKVSKTNNFRLTNSSFLVTGYFFLALIFLAGILIPNSTRALTPSVEGQSTDSIQAPAEIVPPLLVATSVKAKKTSQASSVIQVTEEGDDLLVLVNKQNRLPQTYEPKDLVVLNSPSVWPGLRLRAEAVQALKKMTDAAKKQGLNLVVLSAYRSFLEQEATFNFYVKNNGLTAAERFSAKPGHSQHQLGTALDFTTTAVGLGVSQNFASTKEWVWLEKNSPKYGFILSYPKGYEGVTGYIYEPWHYRYIGVENAQELVKSGLILEEFLQEFGV